MKLLIVDDEVIIRTGLSTVIQWEDYGYELLEPAASAEEALARIGKEMPDIVLTDIQMTGLTGLDLAGEIKRQLPDSEVIILTGYDQFSYAQQAIREGVSDYLLKTSRPPEILGAVNGARHRIVSRWESMRRDDLRDRMMERLVTGNGWEERSLEQAVKLFPKLRLLEPGGYQVVLLNATGWGEENGYNRLLLFAVHNMLNELMEDGEVMLREKDILVVLRDRHGDALTGQLDRYMSSVERKLKCTLFAAAGGAVSDRSGLNDSHEQAAYAILFRGMLTHSHLITYGEVKARKGGPTMCTSEEEKELTARLQGGDETALAQWAEEAVSAHIMDEQSTPESLQSFIHSILLSAHRWAERMLAMIGDASYADKLPQGVPLIPLGQVADRGKGILLEQLKELMKLYRSASGHEGVPYIHKAIAYIHDHLDKDLTLQQVAKHVHLTPNHFSEVFKRETGQTYIEFVTRARIERAKQLLDESPVKVSEIAVSVGYSDIKYFGQLFKRYTGYTPSEYRARE
ncbi:response regulator [Paenibacillus sp. J5C_2022]|uniref:response regulator n=1 Tax=Paenibacillus sp. J5C2022 TaxID=2977129 RepID=UPI0021D18B95|nr:response regulator [Paenibacillus sp. J5C2022]MCU6711473.1 response regulator [Paenibacillus sp. J5C2022]